MNLHNILYTCTNFDHNVSSLIKMIAQLLCHGFDALMKTGEMSLLAIKHVAIYIGTKLAIIIRHRKGSSG